MYFERHTHMQRLQRRVSQLPGIGPWLAEVCRSAAVPDHNAGPPRRRHPRRHIPSPPASPPDPPVYKQTGWRDTAKRLRHPAAEENARLPPTSPAWQRWAWTWTLCGQGCPDDPGTSFAGDRLKSQWSACGSRSLPDFPPKWQRILCAVWMCVMVCHGDGNGAFWDIFPAFHRGGDGVAAPPFGLTSPTDFSSRLLRAGRTHVCFFTRMFTHTCHMRCMCRARRHTVV